MSAKNSLYKDLETVFPDHDLVLDATLCGGNPRELMRFCLAMFDAEHLDPARCHLSGGTLCFRVSCHDHTQIERLERRVDHMSDLRRTGWSVTIGRKKQAAAA